VREQQDAKKTPGKDPVSKRESGDVPKASEQLAMTFHPNVGQADPAVRFVAHGHGYGVFLTTAEAALVLATADRSDDKKIAQSRQNPDEAKRSLQVLRWRFLNANSQPKLFGLDEVALKTNYLRGNNRKDWQTNVASYGKIRIADLYKGIDVLYSGRRTTFGYEFVIGSGAEPGSIQVALTGAQTIRLADNGDLLLSLANRELRQTKPVAYQEAGGAKAEVDVKYVLKDGSITFAIGDYDHTRPLIIDPTLNFAVMLGTTATDVASDVAVDATGAAYVTGRTDLMAFSGITGSVEMSSSIFVLKVDRTGTPVYLTLMGHGEGRSIKVTGTGKVYVTGTTSEPGIAVTPGVSGAVYRGRYDAFVSCLTETGSNLVFSTYVGGTGDDRGAGIEIDSAGAAYVVGTTESADFPGVGRRGLHGSSDVFFIKVDSNGRFHYPSLFGGSASDTGVAIALDDVGGVYVTGQTTNDFPTTPGAYREGFPYPTPIGGFIFVVKLYEAPITTHVPSSLRVSYSTLVGNGEVRAIAVHNRTAYITGATADAYPSTAGAFSRDPHLHPICFGDSCLEAFVTRLNATGTALVYSTFLGGINDDLASDIAVDSRGFAYVTGQTGTTAPALGLATPSFPTTSDAVQPAPTIFGYDAFLTVFSEDGSTLRYSTFIGTPEMDIGTGIAVVDRGALGQSAYVAGYTTGLPSDLTLFRRPVGSDVQVDELFLTRFDF